LRRRQGHDRTGDAEDLAVLRRDVFRADAGHVPAGNLAVAAAARAAVMDAPHFADAPVVRGAACSLRAIFVAVSMTLRQARATASIPQAGTRSTVSASE